MKAQNNITQPKYMLIGKRAEDVFEGQKIIGKHRHFFKGEHCCIISMRLRGGAKTVWNDGLRNDENPKS
jgi:hypothetical protein